MFFVIMLCLGFLIFSVGYYNIDTSFNAIRLNATGDTSLGGIFRTPEELYSLV